MSMNSKKSFIFMWEIDNFMLCMLNNNATLSSPVFESNAFKGMLWFLDIKRKDREDHISCYLNRVKCLQKDVGVRFSLALINGDDEVLESVPDEVSIFSQTSRRWGYDSFCKIDKLENATSILTIRCIMILADTVLENSRCKGRTKIVVEKSNFLWKIEEIKHFPCETSKIFSCSSSAHMEIVLTASEDDDFVYVCINKVSIGSPESHYVSCELSLLDFKEIEQHSKKTEHLFKSENDYGTWKFPNFLRKSIFQSEKNKYIKNGSFTLMCKFSISIGDSIDYIEEYDNNKLISIYSGTKEDSLKVLQRDLERMFSSRLQTDINLSAENRIFQVHKSILSARSPVFSAMFEKDLLENETGVVDIPDVDSEILESFLKFMYTGAMDNLIFESASKLLILADKYQVSSLKKQCSSFLMLNVSISNACDVVLMANTVGDKVLKAYAMDYIAAHAKIIFSSEHWSRCIQKDIKLATEIFNNLSINV